ncbi:hypothetical protein [Vreelandella venusta]|uniref:Uncharacterized protein n=1 Tax=Vreelandella venusta TaxID=44935 RepID=A0ABX2BEB0_9GAMM|nr:hypothetical protein [Halomonas venusta]AZM97240.1 hypothetical protein EI420_16930 [Halomonas venusta]MDX1712281.1 hypothetical protein [Halomonas venusta]NPT32468.1 hypothetical protein [Halomonas venusta]
MKETKKNLLGWALTLGVLLSSPVQANSAAEACGVMTQKLAVISGHTYWNGYENRWEKTSSRSLDETLDSMVIGAYQLTRSQLEERWPGFWDWSRQELLKAWQLDLNPDQLQSQAYSSCVLRWS